MLNTETLRLQNRKAKPKNQSSLNHRDESLSKIGKFLVHELHV
jgi:hypothetical protein